MVQSTLDKMRSEAYRSRHIFWFEYHALRKRVKEGMVKHPFPLIMSRKTTAGNLLIAAIFKIINLKEEIKYKDDRISNLMVERDTLKGTINEEKRHDEG